MGHSYNNGLHTSSKGITIDAIKVTGLNVASGASALCTLAEDAKSGLIRSVTHTAAGTYVFQLSAPYPPKLVTCEPHLTTALATSPLLRARYQEGSYSATTGQFTVFISDATPAAANPTTATQELHVNMKFNRYTR